MEFSTVGLKGRILSLFFLCFIINTALLMGFNFYVSHQSSRALMLMDESLDQLRIVSTLERKFGEMIQAWKNKLLRGHDPANARKYGDELNALEKNIQEQVAALREVDKDHRFQGPLTEFSDAFGKMMQGYRSAQAQFLQPQSFQPGAADVAVRGIDRNVLIGISKAVNLVEEQAQKHREDSVATNLMIVQLSCWGSLLFGVAFMGFFTYFLNRIMGSLNAVTQQLTSSQQEVTQASTLIAQSSTELSSSVAEQASTMQQIVASIDEISIMVQRNTEATQDSLHLSTSSQKLALTGETNVREMAVAIHDISQSQHAMTEAMSRSHEEISQIIQLIEAIGHQTRVINDIVFQTKLLSFNASVEAARAGEHGKGFAVVAEEVGQLAQMSGRASREIAQMLDDSQNRVRDIIERARSAVNASMETGKSKMNVGIQMADECGKLLAQITASNTAVHQRITEIATASLEQARGIQEVTKAMTQIEEVSHQNATVAEQCSTAGEKLNDESGALQSVVVSLLKLMGTQAPNQKAADAGFNPEDEARENDPAMPWAA